MSNNGSGQGLVTSVIVRALFFGKFDHCPTHVSAKTCKVISAISCVTLTHSLTLSCTTEELSAPRDLTDEPLVALPSPPALMDPDPLLQVGSPYTKSLPQPIGRPERPSSSTSEGFQKAPGAEVKSRSLEDDGQVSE